MLHLHGAVTEPDGLVLDSESYERTSDDRRVKAIIHELGIRYRMAFYGHSLNDDYLRQRMTELVNPAEHVLVCTVQERPALEDGRAAVSLRRHHVLIDTVGQHADLPGHVHEFLLTPAPRPAGARVEAAALQASGVYILNDLVDLRDAADPQDRILAAMMDDPDKSEPVTEMTVLDGHRTVVVGAVGTGKSDLLAYLSEAQRPDRPAVLIRLGDQRFTAGEPERILASWAASGRTASTEVDVSHYAVSSTSMHFLLDGLDEVPGAEQDAAADLIARIARRLPQHSFTVTSRPTSALDRLIDEGEEGRPTWALLGLQPGRGWQRRFLQHRAVEYEQLVSVLPELHDMADVLATPFFLARIVDLYQADRLAGHRDVSALLSALIDFQLAREEMLLDLGAHQVRRWLEDLALAGVLAGRKSFDDRQLLALELPAGAEGDQRQLAEQLVHRLLFAENASVYRFTHRIFAEYLATEALLRREVTQPSLDCLAPRASDGLSGTRDDVALTVTLLCRQSTAWRQAVAGRDPLIAAAATPDDATPAEREDAARTLWDIYSERGVWMWDRRHSSLLDHCRALGRLLAHDPHGQVAADVRAALHRGTAQQQGNAITAWSHSHPDWLEEQLASVLRDDGRDGVVLRQTALAALECRFVDLVDELLRVLTVSRDSSVQQTVGFALIELMPKERRLELGRAAMRTPEADLMLHRLADVLEPVELVLLAAEHPTDGHSLDRRIRRRLQVALTRLGPDVAPPEVVKAAWQVAVMWRLDAAVATHLAVLDPRAAALGLASAWKWTGSTGTRRRSWRGR